MKELDQDFFPKPQESILQRASAILGEFAKLYVERGSNLKSYEDASTDVSFNKDRNPIGLPRLDIEKVILKKIQKIIFDEDHEHDSTATDFQFIEVETALYSDGSPLVLEGDSLDIGGANEYVILFFAEYPAAMVQMKKDEGGNPEALTTEYWHSVQKHYLHPDESEAILEALLTQRDNIDLIFLSELSRSLLTEA